MTAQLRNLLLAATIAYLVCAGVACKNSKLDGKWANSAGTVVLEFSSGRAYLSMGELTAEVTPESVRRLGIGPGDPLVATWKATSTRVVPRIAQTAGRSAADARSR